MGMENIKQKIFHNFGGKKPFQLHSSYGSPAKASGIFCHGSVKPIYTIENNNYIYIYTIENNSYIYMKLKFSLIVSIISLFTSYGQTNFVLDQSYGSDNWNFQRTLNIKSQPMGQSFKPTLSSVGFVKFYVKNNTETYRSVSVYINLRLETLTGNIIGKSDQVYLPGGFNGISTFYFSNELSVTPGLVYCFQPILNSDNGTVHFGYGSNMENYLGGSAFIDGEKLPSDLWFREGIMEIPEPDSYILTCLIISICVGLSCIDRKKS